MIGFVGLLPALLFVAFAAMPFLEDDAGGAIEADPDAPDPGAPVEPETAEAEMPQTEDPAVDPGTPAPETEAEPEPEPEAPADPGTGVDEPPQPAAAPYPSVIAEADGEAALLTLDIDGAALDTLATDPEAPEDGFVAFLDGTDTLEINLADDVGGSLYVLEIADVTRGAESDQTNLSRALYILPEGVTPPADITADTEDQLISELGLFRLGEIDLGQLVTRTDPNTGEVTILEDTRQETPPLVISNRAITSDQAVFG